MFAISINCLSKYAQTTRNNYLSRLMSSNTLNIEKLESETDSQNFEEIDEEQLAREAGIQRRRNKSRLNKNHQNIMNNLPPYSEPMHWTHGTLKYQRKIYGTYGKSSNFDPALCWNKEEIARKERYECVAHPKTVVQLIQEASEKRQAKQDEIRKQQDEIHAKMQNVKSWAQELNKKIAKKEAEALAAKQQKDKLIEEVRRHFGFTVDPRDERFQEMLEKKEKEQKKAAKEARKKERERTMVERLTIQGKAAAEKNEQANNEDTTTKS